MSNVTITTTDKHVFLVAPYNPVLPTEAKKLGGLFNPNGKAWYFDIRDAERVRALARLIYGTDGSTNEVLTTIKIKTVNYQQQFTDSIFVAGRCIARAYGRDSGAKLGENVIQLKGTCKSGGSVKNWTTEISAGSVFEIRDIPVKAVQDFDFLKNGWELITEPNQKRS